MADHPLSERTPDAIMTDFGNGLRGLEDVDMYELLWEVIDSVRDSYALAMRAIKLPPEQIAEIESTVEDYVTNAFGDD